MIPTTEEGRDMDNLQQRCKLSSSLITTTPARLRWLRPIAAVLVLLLVHGCTNSKLIIAPLYNRLDDQMRGEFNKLGDFNEQQIAAFEATLGTYHVWHRQSELPQYANLMKNVAASIRNSDTTDKDIQRWFDIAERHSLLARECHPVNFLFDFMKSLTDEQLTYIQRRFEREQQKNRDKYPAQTLDEKVERRLRSMTKWAGRIGLEFTPTQRAMLMSTLKQQTSLRKEYYELSAEWKKMFFSLARAQENPNYDSSMSAHLDKFWRILETEYPEKWQANRNLWKRTSLRFVQSMTSEQRQSVSRWMNKMANTLDSIAQDKPSFEHVNDASLGCLIETSNI